MIAEAIGTKAKIAVALGVVLTIAPFAAASHAVSKNYDTSSGVGFRVLCAGPPSSDPADLGGCLGTGLNIGGAVFNHTDDGLGEVPVTVHVADASGGAVPITACQDLDGDNTCGETDNLDGPNEPRVDTCSTSADLSQSDVPFKGDEDTTVFVGTSDAKIVVSVPPSADTCPGPATSGTITAQFGT